MGVRGQRQRTPVTKSAHPKAKQTRQQRFALRLEEDFSPASLPLLVLDILESYRPAWFNTRELHGACERIRGSSVNVSALGRAIVRLQNEGVLEVRKVWNTYLDQNGMPNNNQIREIRFKEDA